MLIRQCLNEINMRSFNVHIFLLIYPDGVRQSAGTRLATKFFQVLPSFWRWFPYTLTRWRHSKSPTRAYEISQHFPCFDLWVSSCCRVTYSRHSRCPQFLHLTPISAGIHIYIYIYTVHIVARPSACTVLNVWLDMFTGFVDYRRIRMMTYLKKLAMLLQMLA